MDPETFCQSCSMPLDNPEFPGQKKMAQKATNIASIVTREVLLLLLV